MRRKAKAFGDDLEHDFVGASVNARDALIGENLSDGRILEIAVSPKYLQALVGHAKREFGRMHLPE